MSLAFKKVVLLQLPSPWLMNDRDTPLLGPLYLATNLAANGIDVQVADLVGYPPDKWIIPEGDLYGISFTTPQVPMAREAIKLLRGRTNKPITVVGGGFHPSALPQWCLDNLGFDNVFVGEADVEIVNFVKNGSKDKIIRCLPPKLSDLPLLRRDFVDMRSFHKIGINQYVLWSKLKKGYCYEGYLQTGRGCPFDCAYCAHTAVTMRNVRYYPTSHVLAELDELLEKWECELIYVQDDTFNISKKRVKELCGHFKERKFLWHCLCRADLFDEEQAEIMKDSGCLNITFGFESGSERILKAMGKGETVEEGIKAAEAAHKAGLGVRGQMVVGFPGEDDSTIDETVDFMRKVNAEKWGIHAFVPLPGSRSWNHASQFGIDISHNDDFATGFHTIGKPGEWARVHGDEAKVKGWLAKLREVASSGNIDVRRDDV